MLCTAITLAKKGVVVFPCLPRDKRPATSHGVLDATSDLDTIRRWWQQEPKFNIAIATGEPSGVFVVDIDGLDAEAELRRLEAEQEPLPPTVEAITARGRHIYFKMPDATVRNSAGRIAPGIDVRATGGYVLAPPSIHPTGRPYSWSVDAVAVFAAAPEWLLAKIAASAPTAGKTPLPPEQWREIVAGAAEGTRNTSITRLAGYLLRRRVDPAVALVLLELWNETRYAPPLSADEIARIVDLISGAELRRRNGHGQHR